MGIDPVNFPDEEIMVPPRELKYIPYRLKATWNRDKDKISGVEMPGLVEINRNFEDSNKYS